MNNEDNVYELLGNVQVLTKEGVETKFEELEESLSQKINDALGTSLDEKIDEAVSNAIIDVGDVTTEMLNEVKTELVATDTALQAADTLLDQRITALENAGPSGGTGDVTTEMLNEVKTELVATDTALQAADTLLDQRITALENAGPSGGSTTDELLVLTLAVDAENITDTTTWLLKEAINFDTLYQSYLAKTNKPVVINITRSDLTSSIQYSFRDVITSAEDTQIRITGDAMSAVIAPNIRFTIDLALIKDEATGNCIVNTTESKFLMQKDAGPSGGTDDAVSLATFNEAIDRLDAEDAAIKDRLTELETREPGTDPSEPSEEPDTAYTYIIDSQEKFDAFCVATNATEADGNDYSHVYIKNGEYTIIEGHAIRLDNEVVPVLSITGESKEGVVITIQAAHAFFCANDNTDTERMPCIQHISFISADLTTLHSISEKAEKGSSSISATTESKTNCAYELIGCLLNVSGPIAVRTLRTCTVNLTIPTMTQDDLTPYNKYIQCECIQDSTVTIDCTAQLYNNTTNIIMLNAAFNTNNSVIINTTVTLDKMFPQQASSTTTVYHGLSTITGFTCCNNSHCFLADSAFMLFTANSSNIADKPCHAFSTCKNVTNCSATNFKVSFYSCTNISDSIAYIKYACIANKSGNYYYNYTAGFESCHKVINCSVNGAPSLETDPINSSNSAIVPEGTYTVTADLRANIYGFMTCTSLVNCTDNIEAIHSLCGNAALQYISFANCGNLIACGRQVSFTYNVYKTLNTSVTTPINISFFTNCDSLTNAYTYSESVRIASGDYKAIAITCTDKREDKSSYFITEAQALNMYVMRECRDISQSFICAEFSIDATLCIHSTKGLLYQCTRVITSQCIAYRAYPNGVSSTVGIQNCTITSPDTATCSASQTYAADYAVADTPAGGFNKIL